MINLLMGPPGGGKSYEATVYHVLVALNRGRKIITNLPLNLDELELICPGSRELVEFRETQLQDGELVRPFSRAEHYGDGWRHPQDGSGPLYVIDECHMCLPFRGTPVDVEEWYAMHRHELADVLLITQSYGKINKNIRDLVQVVYRCKKATALGSNGRYIRKVQDGLRGEVVNTTIRTYESKYFKLYKSHTRSGAGQELASADIKPIWSNWTFRGAAVMFVLAAVILYNTGSPLSVKKPPAAPASAAGPAKSHPAAPASPSAAPSSSTVDPVEKQIAEKLSSQPQPKSHPWDGYGLHLVAVVHGVRDGKEVLKGLVSVTQNGYPVAKLPLEELVKAGYSLEFRGDCVVSLSWGGKDVGYAVCDSPKVAPSVAVASGG